MARSLAAAAVAVALVATGCPGEPGGHDVAPDAEVEADATPHGLPTEIDTRPVLMVRAAEKPQILDRLDAEPHASVLEKLRIRAARDHQPERDPAHWDHLAHGANAETAQANAMLAWLLDDEAAAEKARELLLSLPADYHTHDTVDIHIRMAHTLIGYTNALDLLAGTPYLSAADFEQARETLIEINRQFYDEYVDEGGIGRIFLQMAQNNYNVRTAGAIGMVALAFPDAPEADTWIDWATSELRSMFGEQGEYVQKDGGVAEDPYYYNLSFSVALAFFIAYDNVVGEPREFDSICSTRSFVPGWHDHDCVDGEPFVYHNFLHDPRFWATADWSISLRLPSGQRPPLGDGRYCSLTGGALLSRFSGEGWYLWDWLENAASPMEMTYSLDLIPHHLAHLPDTLAPSPPPWTNRFLVDAGHAVFRSGWDPEARWLLLLGEQGPSRRAIHDHVDGTSFSMAAYGEYLLLDPGYYKPDNLANAKTAQSWAHNVVLIDGRSAPDKGLLTSFGDADAFIRNPHSWDDLAYAESHQTYQETTVQRSVVFVRGRYFAVGDRLSTTHTSARTHAWRLGGYAGFEAGGAFTVYPDGARWERTLAGVDVRLTSTATPLQVVEPPFIAFEAPHVHEMVSHADVGHHGVIDGLVDALAPSYLAVLAPYQVGAPTGDERASLSIQRLSLPEGIIGFLVESASHQEVILLRIPDSTQEVTLPGGEVLHTDAELVVLTLTGPSPVALMARGTILSLDGEPRVSAAPGTPVAIGP